MPLIVQNGHLITKSGRLATDLGCCCSKPTCNTLGRYYSAAQSLELEVIAEDYVLTEFYQITDLGLCNLFNVPVSGRHSRPWSRLSGVYSLTKRIDSITNSYWRYVFPQAECGIYPRIDAYIGPDGSGLHIIEVVVSALQFSGCDILNGSLSDECTASNYACLASDPFDPSTTVITQSRKVNIRSEAAGTNSACVSGKWSGTEIDVLSNNFPDLVGDPGKPSPHCLENQVGRGPIIEKIGDSEAGNRTVQIKNISFVF